ncbi:MAG: right-handed parallel beta-helix repeat-containing protein [Chloroflexota bacterium]|nr:right-handed parallel beta-helix repeat-containing protein [Chloroflexota bacterium]
MLLKRGSSWTSTLSVTESGTSDAPIVVDAYGIGDHPIIQHKSNGVMLSGSYIIVRNIHVNNHSWSGVYISGSFNRIENSLVTNNVAGIYVKSGAACNGIVGNVIKDNNKMSVLTRRSGDDSGAFGVLIHGDFTEVAYNTISGSDAFSYDFDLDGAAVEIYGGQNNDIHHNLAIDNHAFTELGHPRSANNTFAYNVVRSSLDTSTFLVTRGAGSRYGPVMTTRVLNNSVYMTGNGSQGFVCHAGCGSDILMMRNNIIQAVAKTGFADAPFDEDYNLYHGGQHQFTMGSHSVVTDPLFVDPVAGDLHLQSTSPAIDAGAHLGYTIDIDGQSVALDGNCDGTASPDFGAYEYVCTD